MIDSQKDFFDFVLLKHFGLICLALTIVMAGVQKLYSLFRVKKFPELKDGYQKLITGYLIFMGLPWVVLAMGELVHSYSGILFLFSLKDGNLFSWLFYVILFGEYTFLVYWVWLKGGGERLYKYQLMTYNFSSPLVAKLAVSLMILGGVLGSVFLVILNFSI